MVRHFQHLFRIPQLQGVYPTMTSLSHQIETNKNIMNRIKDILDLGELLSKQELVFIGLTESPLSIYLPNTMGNFCV